jgi:glycosyltransferase involved in cell wall biosynthesis
MIEPKGIADLVEAARILHRRGVAHRLELHGGIDSHNPTAIRAERLAEWQREGLIDWRGATRDVASVWRRCDIAVLASQGGEGMPRAMLEAASCARPLVVTDIPGCRHFVRDGQEGLVVPPRDPERLADAIARLAADRALRERMGLAARARVLDGFTEQQLEAAVAAVYRDLHAAPAFRS